MFFYLSHFQEKYHIELEIRISCALVSSATLLIPFFEFLLSNNPDLSFHERLVLGRGYCKAWTTGPLGNTGCPAIEQSPDAYGPVFSAQAPSWNSNSNVTGLATCSDVLSFNNLQLDLDVCFFGNWPKTSLEKPGLSFKWHLIFPTC